MRRMRATIAPVLLLLMAGTVAAQQSVGTVAGTVVDMATGEPLGGAEVRVTGTSVSGLTNQDGRYLLRSVPAGEHVIRVAYIGYAAARRASVGMSSCITSTCSPQAS